MIIYIYIPVFFYNNYKILWDKLLLLHYLLRWKHQKGSGHLLQDVNPDKFPKIKTHVMTTARVQMLSMELSIFKFKINGHLLLDAYQDKFLKIQIHVMIIVKVQMLWTEQWMYKLNLKLNTDHQINVLTQFSEIPFPAIMRIPQNQTQSL